MDIGMDRDLGSTWWETPPNPELSGHVVVGVDGSAPSGNALAAAVAEADRRDVRLEIVHGRPWGRRRQSPDRGIRPYHAAQAVLAEAATRAVELRPGLRVTTSLVDRRAGGVWSAAVIMRPWPWSGRVDTAVSPGRCWAR